MPKLFLILFFFIGVNFSLSAREPFYELKKDKRWLDSLRGIVKWLEKKGYYDHDNNFAMKKYFHTNLIIGGYYEKMYRNRKLPDMKKAIEFYTNITNQTGFPGNDIYHELAAVRNTLSRKLSAIYFLGKGIKPDREAALQLALKGIGNSKELFKKYSRRFYHCECFILDKVKVNDSLFELTTNPFYYKVAGRVGIGERELSDIANFFSSYDKSGQGYLYMIGYTRPSSADQARTYRVLDDLKIYFEKNTFLPAENITYDVDYIEPTNLLYINYKTQKEK